MKAARRLLAAQAGGYMRDRRLIWLMVAGPAFAGCGEIPIEPEIVPSFAVPSPDGVTDLRVVGRTSTALTVTWTQVDDGAGGPATYRLKYAPPPIDWRTATIGCDRTMRGTSIGSSMSCEVQGLAPGSTYELQMMSFRVVDGAWQGALYSNIASGSTSGATAFEVTDLEATGVTSSTIDLSWTQVDDGTGAPAWYRVKYATPPIDWGRATIGCDRTIRGTEIGSEISCTIEDLTPGRTYDVQLMSYRLVDGVWRNARYSNVATTTTSGGEEPPFSDAVEFAVRQMTRSIEELSSSQHARSTRASDGTWTSSGASNWTSGFFAGTQWLLYELTGDASWRTRAEAQTAALAGQELNGTDHDIGFRILASYGQGHRLTGSSSYRQRILTAARTFASLYDPRIGMTRSQPPRTIGGDLACRDAVRVTYPVIIDNMMNIELFFRAAAEGGDPAFHDIAVSHALRSMEHHLRADGSTWQYVDFDTATAAVRFKGTHQGYCDDTTWARGQSWAAYGFAMAYRYTQDTRFLEAARRAADYFVDRLPADRVPYWDFQVPNPGAGTPKEASAAAAAAAGMIELAGYVADGDRYLNAARDILEALASPAYLSEGTPHRSILRRSNGNVNSGAEVNVGHIYADYYFLEAILRYREALGE
jgi:hypothetical protein